MNAKEISDATLESVSPADNDLMLIYDTSEGTTGKATITNIKNLLASEFVTKTELKIVHKTASSDNITVSDNQDVVFSIDATMQGYTPIAISLLPLYSARLLLNFESFTMESGHCSGRGFARMMSNDTVTLKIRALITWIKNF